MKNNVEWSETIMKVSELKMGAARKIRMLVAANEITVKELAALLETSQSNMANKLKRDNFSEKELEEIANVCGATVDIIFTLKDGTKI